MSFITLSRIVMLVITIGIIIIIEYFFSTKLK